MEPGFFQWCSVTNGGQTVEQVAETGCGVSTHGDIQTATGHNPEQPAAGDPA